MIDSNEKKDHPSSYMVVACNDGDEVVSVTEYSVTLDEAQSKFDEVNGSYDNVYIYQLIRCNERK